MSDTTENRDVEAQNYNSHAGAHEPIAKIVTAASHDDYVYINNQKVNKKELLAAFGGDFFPGLHTAPQRKFANPSPLGLCSFALTTFVLSLINVHARHLTQPSIVVSLAFFYGGLAQVIAGIWEIVVENTFGATALTSYGCFWLSYAAILTPAFGIVESYEKESDLASALGFFLFGWFIFTFLLLLCTLRSTVAFFMLFLTLDITFLLLACGELSGKVGVSKAGGWFGIVTALIAWYNAFAGIATKENSYFTVTPIFMPGAVVPAKSKEE